MVMVSERVLDVRAKADRTSKRVGNLQRGETAAVLDRIPRWYRIKLKNDTAEFIAESWSVVITIDSVPAVSMPAKHAGNFHKAVKATLLAGSDHGAHTWGRTSAEWSKATAPEVVIYSAGTKYGQPSCFAANSLNKALVTVPRHNAICGLSNAKFWPY